MSKKASRKSIPVNLEKAQEASTGSEIRPKMQLNVPEEVVAGIKTKQQMIEEEEQRRELQRTEEAKKEFQTKMYYWGGIFLGAGIAYLSYRYFFKSNTPPVELVGAVINGTV